VAIDRIRSEAQQTSCRNNLRQLSLSFHNYVETYNNTRLPSLTDQDEGAPTGIGLSSVFANLIPYIEAGPVLYRPGLSPTAAYHGHSSIPFTYQNKDGSLGTSYGGIANQAWRVFIDPADSSAERLRDLPMMLPDGTTGYYATGSYAANGQLPWGRAFPSGLSSLVLFGERPQVCRTSTGEDIYNLWGLGFYSPHMPAFAALTPEEPPGLWSTGQIAPVRPLADSGAIEYRVGREDAAPERFDDINPIQLVRPGRICDPRLPGTPHRRGMQVAMADGSVRIFTRETDPRVFWAACMPAESVE
jgi:prepilin-type processing-associated H-X9-DG protein